MNRQLAKTLTFALLHLIVGFSVTYAFTGSVVIASGVALVEPLVNAVVFYFHELGWQRVGAGKPSAPKPKKWRGMSGSNAQAA